MGTANNEAGEEAVGLARTGCSVATALTVEERRFLADLEFGANRLEDFTWCELEPGHEGEWHYALGQSAIDGHWWLRWRSGARELVNLANCPADDGAEPESTPCLLFADHPAGHDFEYEVAQNHLGLLHRALTVGDLRKVMEHLDDATAIRIGATGSGVLPDTPYEVLLQATGEGATPSRLLGGAAPALVLLIGLNSMAERDVE